MNDLRFAIRQLLKHPGFSVVAIVTLAVGIGANTVIFSAVNALFLRPLPYPAPDRLVRVFSGFPDRGLDRAEMSWPRYQEFAAQQQVFSEMGATAFTAFTLSGRGDPEQVQARRMSGPLFAALGVRPSLGRTFTAEEDRPGGPAVVLVSHRYWQQRLGGDANIIGQSLILNGRPHTLTGVLPSNLTAPFAQADLWVPHADQPEGLTAQFRDRGSGYLQIVGRLKPGISLAEANEALRVIARRYGATVPDKIDAKADVQVISLREDIVGAQRGMFGVLAAAVGCVLLIGCANVANLLLARFSTRRREVAVRAALGADRWRLVGQFMLESLLLALAAGLLGTLLSVSGVEIIRRLGADFIPRSEGIILDWAVLGFSLAVSLLTGVVLGFVPAWQVTRHDLEETLKDAARGTAGTLRHGYFRAGLVIVEVALALILLVGAGLLLLSFGHLLRVSPGFNPEGVAVVNFAVPPALYGDEAKQTQFFERVQEGIKTIPGVKSVSASTSAPFDDGYSRSPVAPERSATDNVNDRPLVLRASVLPGYFSTLGIPMLRGRDFDARDDAHHPRVVVINETLAKKLFADRDPLGQRLLTGIISIPREIIGIVGDTRGENLTDPQAGEMYYPNSQLNEPFLTFLIRSDRAPAALREPIREVVRSVDAGIPVPELQTLQGLMTQTYADRRLTLWLVGGFAAVALAMAVFGIYSVMAYTVSQRTGEIGIRLALGAQPRDVRSLVVRQGMTLAGAGLALGIAAALSLTHAMAALLFGVGPRDPWAFAGVTLLLAGVSLLACWWPALRAARVDPMVALRTE